MPRQVDHEQRRREIMEVTNQVISESGTRGLSFRAIAQKLGGSTTVVTHYYPSQKELLDDFAIRLIEGWATELEEIEGEIDAPLDRLKYFIEWLLPVDEENLRDERTRISLLADQLLGAENRNMFQVWDEKIRAMLADHLKEIVEPDQIESSVELLRVTTNGVTLSVIERPELWPRERQLKVMWQVLDGMLLDSSPPQRR